jgi:hypothetical protein
MEFTTIDIVENTFEFKYPELFHKLNTDGILDSGKSGPGWYENYYPKLRKKPPFLLFAGEFELMELDQVEKVILKIKSKSGSYLYVVPFGKTGAGNLYCFVYGANKSLDFICLFNKRTDESIKLAKSLEDFMFRELLGAVAEINPDYFQDNEQSFIEDLQAMLASHKAYLSERRFAILEKFYGTPISEQDDTFGAMSLDEFFDVLKQEIDFEGFGEKFDDLVYVMEGNMPLLQTILSRSRSLV